jgi:hypothetical protein
MQATASHPEVLESTLALTLKQGSILELLNIGNFSISRGAKRA